MAEIGSVFDEDESDTRPRGPDLRVTVEVPREALGATLRAPVPARIAANGELVERAILDPEDPGGVVLHLAKDLPSRAILRLRGQGGAHEGGRAGDLMVVVELVERPPRDGERISRTVSELAAHQGDGLATLAGVDVTWWLLLAMGLVGAGLLAAIAMS